VIESRGDHFAVWVKIAPLGESKKGLEAQYETTVSHALALFGLNLELSQMQLLSYVVYDEKDNVLEIESYNFSKDEFQEIPPGIIIANIYDSVMLYHSLQSVE
jgi:hypothetical protein